MPTAGCCRGRAQLAPLTPTLACWCSSDHRARTSLARRLAVGAAAIAAIVHASVRRTRSSADRERRRRRRRLDRASLGRRRRRALRCCHARTWARAGIGGLAYASTQRDDGKVAKAAAALIVVHAGIGIGEARLAAACRIPVSRLCALQRTCADAREKTRQKAPRPQSNAPQSSWSWWRSWQEQMCCCAQRRWSAAWQWCWRWPRRWIRATC